jgi:hypothetical protein
MVENVMATNEPLAAPDTEVLVAQKSVLIIDDELVGLSYSHLSKDVKNLFEDRTSPEFDELWGLVMHIKGYDDLATEDTDKVREFVTSDALVQEIILSDHFQERATKTLKDPLANFFHQSNAALTLRRHLETAFPTPQYQTEFSATRPAQGELLKYDLLIFDLVLEKSASAVDEIIRYLEVLGRNKLLTKLPCIIIMSNRPELIEHRIRFSHESNISAAGLLILPKNEVTKDSFGAPGLVLSYQQLDRQRDIAQRMRVFMHTWIQALDEACNSAGKAMWNLDAAAMQEIHLVAHNDNDPYDEHLNELISREYLWHVESAPAVGKAVEELDNCFQSQFKSGSAPAIIKQRFIAPFVKPEYGRKLVSHYTWTGFPVPKPLSDFNSEVAVNSFNKLVPFGALLAPETLTPETECLIHITQQCDLNQNKAGQSAQFAVVLPIEVRDYKIPSHDTDDLVARGLHIRGKEYDFKLAKGRQLALPIASFVAHAIGQKLNVVGRLRHDIATHFLLATANHMTRWASQKVNHVEVTDVTLHLHGKNFPTGKVTFIEHDTSGPMKVQVATSNKLIYFQDDTSMRVALWVAREMKIYYQLELDSEKICNQLSIGLNNKSCLVNIVDLKMEGIKPENYTDRLSLAKAPENRINLMAIFEPGMPI